jgi:hypothetical protein
LSLILLFIVGVIHICFVHLFTALITNALISARCIATDDTMVDKLRGFWKEEDVHNWWHSHGGTEDSQENHQSR